MTHVRLRRPAWTGISRRPATAVTTRRRSRHVVGPRRPDPRSDCLARRRTCSPGSFSAVAPDARRSAPAGHPGEQLAEEPAEQGRVGGGCCVVAGSGCGRAGGPTCAGCEVAHRGGFGARRHLQDPADGLDAELLAVLVDEPDDHFGRRSSSAWPKSRNWRTRRTASAFSPSVDRRVVGLPGDFSFGMAPSSSPRSGASTHPRAAHCAVRDGIATDGIEGEDHHIGAGDELGDPRRRDRTGGLTREAVAHGSFVRCRKGSGPPPPMAA
jgi:hypothetical protein